MFTHIPISLWLEEALLMDTTIHPLKSFIKKVVFLHTDHGDTFSQDQLTYATLLLLEELLSKVTDSGERDYDYVTKLLGSLDVSTMSFPVTVAILKALRTTQHHYKTYPTFRKKVEILFTERGIDYEQLFKDEGI